MKLDEEDKKVLAKINRELKEYVENLEKIRFVSRLAAKKMFNPL